MDNDNKKITSFKISNETLAKMQYDKIKNEKMKEIDHDTFIKIIKCTNN